MTQEEFKKMGLVKQPDGTFAKLKQVGKAKQNIVGPPIPGQAATFPVRIHLKSLSVNNAYKGRKFKTPEKKIFDYQADLILPSVYPLPAPPYQIYFKLGLSSKSSDGDNCIKVTQDAIARKYKFNDKQIRKWIVETEIVKKGEEYFEFKIESYIR